MVETNEFDLSSFLAPERAGRPSKIIPIFELAVQNGVTFSVPVYTSARNHNLGKEQLQSSRAIQIMRDIASNWTYAYSQGKIGKKDTLLLVFVPSGIEVPFETKSLE